MARSMVLFEWNDSYSVGHIRIDSQHRRLVSLINRLHDAMLQGEGRKESSRILEDLIEYADQHFSTEEKLMESWGYPEIEEHKKEHRIFLSRVLSMTRDMREGEYLVSLELNEFLKKWLSAHIKDSDMRYKPYISDS